MNVIGTKRYRSMAGVTMVEVLCIVTLLGIITKLGTTSLDSLFAAEKERGEAREIFDHLKEARSLARSLLSPVTVTAEGNLLIIAPQGESERQYEMTITLEGFDTADGTITYGADGGTNLANPATLTVRTSRDVTFHYKVFPAIGTVRML